MTFEVNYNYINEKKQKFQDLMKQMGICKKASNQYLEYVCKQVFAWLFENWPEKPLS